MIVYYQNIGDEDRDQYEIVHTKYDGLDDETCKQIKKELSQSVVNYIVAVGDDGDGGIVSVKLGSDGVYDGRSFTIKILPNRPEECEMNEKEANIGY